MTIAQAILDQAAAELPDLQEMFDEMAEGPAIFQPSDFWTHHNENNLQQIADEGFGSFKRTVNTNYFQWEPGSPRGEGPREQVARRLLALWARHPDPRVFAARLLDPQRSLHFGSAARWHAVCVAALWEYARRQDTLGLLMEHEEPRLGEALLVRHRGRSISEDLANSVLEMAAITEGRALPAPGSLVVELGGGYGRLGWLMLKAIPGVRYVVCDIPPALAIAQRYLTDLFGNVPTFRFQRFSDPAAVMPKIARARLAFLLPHQLAALEPLGADLFVNISSLHEMRHDQIATWFSLIDRHTRGHFYTKQWIHSVNVFDDLVVNREEYPVPEHWQTTLDREVKATPGFFETVYRVNARLSDS